MKAMKGFHVGWMKLLFGFSNAVCVLQDNKVQTAG
jgi:hypothetical protein